MRGTKFQQPFALIILVPLSPGKIILQKNNLTKRAANLTASAKHDYECTKKHAPQTLKAPPPFRIKGSMMYKKN